MAFKAVAFDVDGTLYPARALYARAWPLALRHLRLARAFGETRRLVRGTAATEACRAAGEACAEELRRIQAAETARRIGSTPETASALIDDIMYRRIAECFARIRPYRGLEPALDRLRAASLRLAALSDFPPLRKLELMGLADRFEVALSSEDSGFLKPAPEPFDMLAAALGLDKTEILYVGDSLRYDLAGARGAGMKVAIRSRRAVPGADLCFSRWEALADFALAGAR